MAVVISFHCFLIGAELDCWGWFSSHSGAVGVWVAWLLLLRRRRCSRIRFPFAPLLAHAAKLLSESDGNFVLLVPSSMLCSQN